METIIIDKNNALEEIQKILKLVSSWKSSWSKGWKCRN